MVQYQQKRPYCTILDIYIYIVSTNHFNIHITKYYKYMIMCRRSYRCIYIYVLFIIIQIHKFMISYHRFSSTSTDPRLEGRLLSFPRELRGRRCGPPHLALENGASPWKNPEK